MTLKVITATYRNCTGCSESYLATAGLSCFSFQ